MHYLFLKFVDLVFPKTPDARIVDTLTHEEVVGLFLPRNTFEVCGLSSYTDPRVRALIHEAKFYGNKKAFATLNTLFSLYLTRYTQPVDMIIPIPLSRARLRARGYNQVLEILKAGKSVSIPPIATDILYRSRHTRPQTELTKAERLINMRNAFGAAHGELLAGKHILLIDDVTTTGATLRAAKAALLPHSPASVTCIALAH
jgi:ComF family protein